MSKALSEYVSAYRKHLIETGFRFIKSKGNNDAKSGERKAGEWITGPMGTYIFAYIEDTWSESVVGKIFE